MRRRDGFDLFFKLWFAFCGLLVIVALFVIGHFVLKFW